ncbi:RNA methyltransferase [Arcanobacterium haemolyticum]|nr:RNA methyltransferase [Arcanobacterium haemolyticum]
MTSENTRESEAQDETFTEHLPAEEGAPRRASTDVDDPAYERRPGAREIGVGPMPEPWQDDPRYDRELLQYGDHRNVLDKYRYWSVEAIHADLETSRSALHIAIENLEHDLNIGSIVRSGNAFNVGGVHIVGRRRWNKRGAMVTDRYLNIYYHPDPADLAAWAAEHGYELVAIDNPPHSVPLEHAQLPENCLLVFGQESAGISAELQAVCREAVKIEQYGSTRSLNVAAAAAIAMHWWIAQHRPAPGQ